MVTNVDRKQINENIDILQQHNMFKSEFLIYDCCVVVSLPIHNNLGTLRDYFMLSRYASRRRQHNFSLKIKKKHTNRDNEHEKDKFEVLQRLNVEARVFQLFK